MTILGKQYPLKVNESEVQAMQQIARFVDEKFRLYRNELIKQPESTVMVLAALSIAEELFEVRMKQQVLERKLQSQPKNEEELEEVSQALESLLQELRNSN